MLPVLVTPPAVDLLSLDDLRDHCRVDGVEHDDALTRAGAAAEAMLDGPEGMLGRALVTQTWMDAADGFDGFRLSLAPVQSITEVAYTDADGADQVLATGWRLVETGAGASLALEDGETWPAVASRPDAVRVTYSAGYGAPADIPAAIQAAALLLAGHLFEHRAAVQSQQAHEVPITVNALLGRYRRYGGFK